MISGKDFYLGENKIPWGYDKSTSPKPLSVRLAFMGVEKIAPISKEFCGSDFYRRVERYFGRGNVSFRVRVSFETIEDIGVFQKGSSLSCISNVFCDYNGFIDEQGLNIPTVSFSVIPLTHTVELYYGDEKLSEHYDDEQDIVSTVKRYWLKKFMDANGISEEE